MFYRMISRKRDEWFASSACTVTALIEYMEARGELRDAQIDAIKTYLYLKIACECKPLHKLFISGQFNSLNLDEELLSANTRNYLVNQPTAAALYEYAMMTDSQGHRISDKLSGAISTNPNSIEYERVFEDIFSNVSYTDYLFSLPMGAGKTYLMAAFIYLDLYFAMNEPTNPAFAHNFIIFAPSGLKSSVVPSLKTIQNFDPTWVLPDPAASQIKRMLSFEVLDARKSDKKSNKVTNPNVQKLSRHSPDPFGLVVVANAEKVILNNEASNRQPTLLNDAETIEHQANELRYYIGKIPRLAIFIDEVHHAVSEDIKLRQVVSRWMKEGDHFNAVIGFSGTPYRDSVQKIKILDSLTLGVSEIATIVCYYPLLNGIGNFLKQPVVKIAENLTSLEIIDRGVREFLNQYRDTVYEGGLTAKLGIYCGTIDKLEEQVYPRVLSIAFEYGLPIGSILRFHRGNKNHPMVADSQMEFDILDKSISKTRIVLLVQIGKEGWDCRSLTGIILSQEGDCPRNMVLQTSCRCLRQVERNHLETALVYLNSDNASTLNEQLKQQQHITLKEFGNAPSAFVELKRYDRTKYLKLPKVDFYQLRVRYETKISEPADPTKNLPRAAINTETDQVIISTTDFAHADSALSVHFDKDEYGTDHASFYAWLYSICRNGLGTVTMAQLMQHELALQQIFDTITYEQDGERRFSSHYDRTVVEANIRKAFCDLRHFETIEEEISQQASLLRVENFTSSIRTVAPQEYYPDQTVVKNIIDDDRGKFKANPNAEMTIQTLLSMGMTEAAEQVRAQNASHPQKDRSFHVLPYHTDSDFEIKVLKDFLAEETLASLGLEVYFNGDRALTEFKIACYQSSGGAWYYIGKYTPDFLVIQRKDGAIHKAIIAEAKGGIYANADKFPEKRHFVETKFIPFNNDLFGYKRFDYLYLEDSLTSEQRKIKIHEKISAFFAEV